MDNQNNTERANNMQPRNENEKNMSRAPQNRKDDGRIKSPDEYPDFLTERSMLGDNENSGEPTREMPVDATRINDIAKKTSEQKNSTPEKKTIASAKKSKKSKKKQYTETDNSMVSLIKCIAYITVVVIIAAVISAVVIFSMNDIYGFVKSEEEVEIVIPEDATINDIATILHDNKVINYKGLFKSYAKKRDDGKGFCAGTYSISPKTGYKELIAAFKEKAPSGVSWITIPEGYTTDEIIDLLVEKGIGEKEKYIDVINNYDFDYWFIDELGDNWAENGRFYRLDGYLFPDTYQFYNASTEEAVIKKMLSRFKTVFTKKYRARAEELGFTVDQVLILASIIEKEGGTPADFGNISSVFHNRMNRVPAMNLESDATIVYAMQHATGERPNLTLDDLTYDSPYNTYTNAGLTPGPIANPSNSAIQAALNPSETNYLFFVSYDGTTTFTASKYEHDALLEEINKKIAAKNENQN
ncbi:MAG: endolytic transglycosylase MltG [Clostridiales bacterium]|nr:endolytic transglycosylase MltG [Clostridiales bacterium]